MAQRLNNDSSARLLQGEPVASFVNPHVSVVPGIAPGVVPAVDPAAPPALAANNNIGNDNGIPDGIPVMIVSDPNPNPIPWKPKPGRLASMPITQQITFPFLIVLLAFEVAAMTWNVISEADVAITKSGVYDGSEDVTIGWNQLMVTTESDIYWGDGKIFNYYNRCGEYDCDYCIAVNWCKIESRGIEWYIGCWFRLLCAITCIIICCIMGVRGYILLTYKFNNEYDKYINSNEKKSYKTNYYRKNKSLMIVMLFCLFIWIGCGVLNIHLWNNNNPVFDFDKVGWSVSFYIVCLEIFGCALVFLVDLVEFCWKK